MCDGFTHISEWLIHQTPPAPPGYKASHYTTCIGNCHPIKLSQMSNSFIGFEAKIVSMSGLGLNSN